MSARDDFYGPRRGEMTDTGAYLGFLVGFLGAAPFGWAALMASFEDGADATLGVIYFAVKLVVGGLGGAALGFGAGAASGALWERRHRGRQPTVKPEAGPDLASLTGAPAQDTVAAVARAWQRQAARAEGLVARFEQAEQRRVLPLATFELVRLGEQVIGRATLAPGWRWSTHVGPAVEMRRLAVEQAGLVLSGAAEVVFDEGEVLALVAGAAFHLPARPHDIFVTGDTPCVLLHWLGAERVAPVRATSVRT